MVSERVEAETLGNKKYVLILVLVEDGLGAAKEELLAVLRGVLILVLVEDGLGGLQGSKVELFGVSLNPCFSGGWSRSRPVDVGIAAKTAVLILVLVEDGLGAGIQIKIVGCCNRS